MKYLPLILGISLCVAGCATDNSSKEAEEAVMTDSVFLKESQWKLAEFNASDSTVKVDSAAEYVMTFLPADSTFNLTTDCNSIGGKYEVKGDSIKFDNLFSTRMMCPDATVEEGMNQVLQKAQTVKVSNDTVLTIEGADHVKAVFNKQQM